MGFGVWGLGLGLGLGFGFWVLGLGWGWGWVCGIRVTATLTRYINGYVISLRVRWLGCKVRVRFRVKFGVRVRVGFRLQVMRRD